MSCLCVDHLEKTFKGRTVVRDVSLKVNSSSIVGLLGPNGAGKTTSFYMIVGLITADRGRVSIDERDLSRVPMHGRARAGIGYLPQEASIFRKLTVADNILSVLETRGDLTRKQRLERLDQLLDEFHVTHLRRSLGMSLSGGERRRVEIARALALEPSFVLLDEPFAGVDPISVNDIKSIITHLRDRGIGVLITDHNVRETLTICENAYIVSSGEVIAEGPPEHILQHDTVRKVYLGDAFSL